MSTAAAASSAFASSGGVDQRVLRSSNARTKRLLKRLLKRQMTEPVTAEANSSTSSGRKRKAEEVEGSTAKKSNGEPQVTITELNKKSKEYQRVAQSCITSELDFEGLFAVTKIERIEIPRLQRLFEAKKNAMAATDDHHHASPSVQVAYHGTAEQNIRSIAQNNLSMDCVGRNTDCSFGAGMYVSPHSNLAAGYSGTGTIIHFDVLRGRVYTCPDERDCRQIPLEPGHDSHQWDEEEDIWVVFDSHQLLPRYIITGGFDGSFDY